MSPLALINPNDVHTYWFILPLVVAMSCVYSASRVEAPRRIAWQSIRLGGMILGVLAVTMAILLMINTRV